MPDWPLDESDYAAMRAADEALAEGGREGFVSLDEVKRHLAADEAAEQSQRTPRRDTPLG